MKTRLIALLMLGALALPTAAPATPPAITLDMQKDVMVTIYNGNLGLVKDVREIRLPAGTTDVQFMDVAALIDPTTVHLKSITDPAGLKILEQNYEYDLLSSDKLMEKYVGKRVRLYQPDGSYHEATLLSTNGPVYEINGHIHLGHNGHLILPALPENLVSRPTLAWLLRNQATAPQRVEASYLTSGITWRAITSSCSTRPICAAISPDGSRSTTRAGRSTGTRRSSWSPATSIERWTGFET